MAGSAKPAGRPAQAKLRAWELYRGYRIGVDRIVIDPDICNGQPVVRGTRITARTVIEFLAAGDSIADVLEEYPTLTREDVLACLGLSSDLMRHRFSLVPVA